MQQLELIIEPTRLRGALNHLLAHGLECEDWTRKMHAAHARYLVQHFHDVPLMDVTYSRIKEYVIVERRRGRAVETIRKRLSTLHMAMAESVRMGWLEKVPPWPVLKSDSRPKQVFWTAMEWEQAHLACEDEDLATFIALGFWIGSHTSDIYRQRWCDVDFVNNTIVRRNTKSHATPVVIPMPERLRAILWERHDRLQPHQRDLVCGRNMGHPNRPLKELAARCGIPAIPPIGLRHSCVTRLKEQGCDDQFRSWWIGHKSTKITVGTYTHMTPALITAGEALINPKP